MSQNNSFTRMRTRPSERWISMLKKRYDANEGGIFTKANRETEEPAFKVGYLYRDQYRVVIRVEKERHAYSGLVVAWMIHHGVYPLFPVTAKDGNSQNCDVNNLESED